MPEGGFPWINGMVVNHQENSYQVQVSQDRNKHVAVKLRDSRQPREIVIYLDEHFHIIETRTYES